MRLGCGRLTERLCAVIRLLTRLVRITPLAAADLESAQAGTKAEPALGNPFVS